MEEIWKDIEGYEGYYQVSNFGRIRSLDREVRYVGGWVSNRKGKLLKSIKRCDGYLSITLKRDGKGKGFLVHRLVAQLFIANKENKPQVNHINGIKDDNRVENLEWVTPLQNTQHAVDNKLNCFGERHRKAKLTEKQVIEIRENYRDKSQQEIADMYNVAQTTISMIRNGKNWKHI